jgi:ABC-type phosphate transport system substrate-binding protein
MKVSAAATAALVLAFTALTGSVGASDPPPPPAFHVVVHPKNPSATLEQTFLQDAFLKKVTRWPGGRPIHPADLPAASTVRERFSQRVLRRSVGAVRAYWQQKIFGGHDVPPPELANDEAVVAHVLKTEGAIGYVSGSANLKGVRAVRVVE